MKPNLIILDGQRGSGRTTLAKSLTERLKIISINSVCLNAGKPSLISEDDSLDVTLRLTNFVQSTVLPQLSQGNTVILDGISDLFLDAEGNTYPYTPSVISNVKRYFGLSEGTPIVVSSKVGDSIRPKLLILEPDMNSYNWFLTSFTEYVSDFTLIPFNTESALNTLGFTGDGNER